MSGFTLHHRCDRVNMARHEIENAYLAVADRYSLTPAELAHLFSGIVNDWVETLLQRERHPGDSNKHYSES